MMNAPANTQVTTNCPPGAGLAPKNGAFRVLHTSDWHLGKMLVERSREEEHQRFLDFLLAQVRELAVDVLIVAGDLFDTANPPQSAAAQYYNFLSALSRQSPCQVVIVAGNHDSPAQLEAPRLVLKALGAHVLGALPEAPADSLVVLPSRAAPRLVVAAVPFLRDRDLRTGQPGQSAAAITRELAQGIRRRYDEAALAAQCWRDQGLPVLATGHLAVTGCSVSESERDIHVGGLGAVGWDCFPPAFSYVALGHLHRPQAAGNHPAIRYSGSPLPLSFGEAGDKKELRLLDFMGGGLARQAAVDIPRPRTLVQIRCRRASLEAALNDFQPPGGDLKAWVEVVVEDPVAGENLYDQARKIAQGKAYEVVRVGSARTTQPDKIGVNDEADFEDIEGLLGNPQKIFEHRLAGENALGEPERAALRIAFQELCALHQERQRQEPLAAPPPAAGGRP